MKLFRGSFLMFIFICCFQMPLGAAVDQSQTAGYLNVPDLKKVVKKWLGDDHPSSKDKKSPLYKDYKDLRGSLQKYSKIIKQARAREEQFKNTHYVFYHTFDYRWRIIGDLQKAFYELLTNAPVRDDFIFLRAYLPSFFNLPHINDWLDEKIACYGADFDNYKSDVKDFLLAVNLSLFGRISRPRSFSFGWFVVSQTAKPPVMGKILNQMLVPFIKTAVQRAYYIALLVDLLNTIETKEGNLIQIFIPKNLVNRSVYLCKEKGKVWDAIIDPAIFDSARGRHSAIAPILDLYSNSSSKIVPVMDQLEARILLRAKLFLNPQGPVKMFRYTTLDENRNLLYQKRLSTIAGYIFKQAPQPLNNYLTNNAKA